MQWLPVLRQGTAEWRFPLADPAAAMLSEALITEETDARHQAIKLVLRQHPSLAIWSICHAGTVSATSVSDAWDALSSWLCGAGCAVLAEPNNEIQEFDSSGHDQTDRRRFAELSASSLTFARNTSPKKNLPALISNLADWLSATGSDMSWPEIESGQTCVPAWCVDILRHHPDPDMAQGIDQVLLSEQLTCWSASIPGTGERLRSLTRILHRLHTLESEFQHTLETEKLQALKQFAYGAGHEINNPLANISTRAQTLLGDEQDPERRRKLATINSQAFRAHEMIADLMLFAQPPQLNLQPVNLVATARTLIEQMSERAATHHVQIQLAPQPPETVMAMADRDQLLVALRSICTNALDAIGQSGTIEFDIAEVCDAPLEDQPAVAIHIRDTGPGISAEIRRHIFDPFFSGREAGRGLGFGLSKCWRIITDHGGQVTVDSQLGSGASFTVLLPRAPKNDTASSHQTDPATA